MSSATSSQKRIHKGCNLLELPTNFVLVDIETTGLSPAHDSIIEIAAIRYQDGSVVQRFDSLLKPESYYPGFIDDFIARLTGITDEMISQAPSTKYVLNSFRDFIGGSILIAHNAHFDINFLYDNLESVCGYILSNDFVDTMRIAKLLHKELKHHRLSDLADLYSISYDNAHRANVDCEITLNVYLKLVEDFHTLYGENAVLSQLKRHYSITAKDITTEFTNFDELHPLYGKTIVFTGVLEKMIRKEAMQIVVDHGGINADSVTKKTNYLVLGNNDYCSSLKDGKSTKQKKAEQLLLSGNDISIITEDVFYDMISE